MKKYRSYLKIFLWVYIFLALAVPGFLAIWHKDKGLLGGMYELVFVYLLFNILFLLPAFILLFRENDSKEK